MIAKRLLPNPSFPSVECLFLWLFLPFFASAQPLSPAFATGSPESSVRGLLQSVATIVENPDIDPARKREEVESIIRNSLNLDHMANHVLSGLQADFSDDEKEAFATAFQDFLVANLLQRASGIRSEQINIIGSKPTDSGFVVQTTGGIRSPLFWTRSQTRPHQTRTDYFLNLKSVPPRIDRILIDGIDILQNYRSQFNSLLRRQSPSELVRLLERKTANLSQKNPFTG